MPKITMRCSNCGGSDCGRDAVAVWNDEAQAWELGSVYDASWCDKCGHDDPGLDEVALEDTPEAEA